MNTFHDIQDLSFSSILTIGNFDGCHLGHQSLLRLIQEHETWDQKATVLSFYPDPDDYFSPKKTPTNLFTRDQKKRAFHELNVSCFVEQTFDHEFSSIKPEDFIERVLVQSLHCKHLFVGEDFRFGKKRLGDLALLKKQSEFVTHAIGKKNHNSQAISSSVVRNLVAEEGRVDEAQVLLGRPYLVEGFVGRGLQLGRTIDAPTLNLVESTQLLPQEGVYAGYVWLEEHDSSSSPTVMSLDKMAQRAVICLSQRPTLVELQSAQSLEAHVLDVQLPFDQHYGKKIGFYFCQKIRDNQKFENLDALKTQIAWDKNQATQLLR